MLFHFVKQTVINYESFTWDPGYFTCISHTIKLFPILVIKSQLLYYLFIILMHPHRIPVRSGRTVGFLEHRKTEDHIHGSTDLKSLGI